MPVAIVGKRRPPHPGSRNVLRGQATRRRILDAARARILADGFEALRLDDLGHDAGVTKAAVVKSLGGKASILLELGDEDRLTRIALIDQAARARSRLPRRLTDLARRLLDLDMQRINVVMAYIGYMWFWTGADHARAHAMVHETREHLCTLMSGASAEPLTAEELRRLSLRYLGAYVIGLRDVRFGHATLEESARFIVDYCLA